MNRGTTSALVCALLLAGVGVGAADAQARRAVQNPDRLLDRCTNVPDDEACRSVLRLPISNAQRSIALTYLAESDPASSDSLLREAIRLDSTNALAYVQLGARTVRAGNPAGVILLRRAIALRPDWRYLHERIAASYAAAGPAQLDTLVQLWGAAVAANPSTATARIGLAAALVRAGRLPDAEASYRRAAELDPTDPRGDFGICESLLRQRKLAPAQESCARTIRGWASTHGTDLRQILWYAEEAKDHALALAAAERGLVVEPTSSYFRSDRTRILHLMGRGTEAEALLRAYVAEQPQAWDAVEELADYLYWNGKLADARPLYLRLIDPACPNVGITCTVKGNLATASLRLGLTDDAFRYLEAALAHQIDCPDLLENFRRHAHARPDSSALLARLRRTLQGIGDTVATRHGVEGAADFFAMTAQWERAAHFYRIAIDSADAREREGQSRGRFGLRWEYARALVELGRYCEALREFSAARAADPIFENGRPHLVDALARATEHCREARS